MTENRCDNWNCILNTSDRECSGANCKNCEYREIRKEDTQHNQCSERK